MRYIIESKKVFKGRINTTEERFIDKSLALRKYYMLESNMSKYSTLLSITITGPDFYKTIKNNFYIKGYINEYINE